MNDRELLERADSKVYLLAFPASFSEKPIDVANLWRFARRAAIPAILTGLIFAAAAYGGSFALPRWYRVQAVLMPADSDRGLAGALGGLAGSFGGLAGLAGIRLEDSGSDKAESLAVLRSREFSQQFIVNHELMPKLFASKWDSDRGQWKGNAADAPTLGDAYKYFDEDIRYVSENRTAGTITVTIEWKDPELAAEWANLLVDDLNQYARQRVIGEASESIKFLQKELEGTSDLKLKDSMYRLIQDQLGKSMMANVRKEYAFRVVDPALVPDMKRKIRPRRTSAALLAFILGASIAATVVLRRSRSS